MVSTRDIYHTGFVVENIEAAMQELTAVFGVAWTSVEEVTMPVATPDGSVQANLRFAYSRGEEQRLELLEPVPGTAWDRPVEAGSGVGAVHHVGVWADDFVAASEELVAAGFPRVLTYDDGSGRAVSFAYHRLPSGALIELVDASRRAKLEAWFDGGAYPGRRTDG